MHRSDPDETDSTGRDPDETNPTGRDPDETDSTGRDPDEADSTGRDHEGAYADSLDPADADVDDLDASDADALVCVCEAGDVLDLLASRHAIAVVCVVGALEPVRYGDVEAVLEDASSSTLSTRLSDLVDAGILAREQYDEIPPRVEYELSDDGHALYDALGPLVEWTRDRDGPDAV